MIITYRARWMLVLSVVALLVGVYGLQLFVVQLAVACLLWIGLQWLCFRVHADFLAPRATARRTVQDRQGAARVLWIDRTYEVQLEITMPRCIPGMHVLVDLADMLPLAAEPTGGSCHVRPVWGARRDFTIQYRFRPTTVGGVHFEGLRILLCDAHGYFQAERFLPCPAAYRVLPAPESVGPLANIRKQHNLLMPPGIHVMPRPGVGSELLELRDYVPGDSPRGIAWKVSARRDTLMSKQYESEVPVRCHLVMDMSPAMRMGYPGPCPAQRLVTIAATVAQTLSAHRDPVGLAILGGARTTVMRPSASRQAVIRMLDQLASAMDQPPPAVRAPAAAFVKPAFDLARARYPQAFRQSAAALLGPRLWPASRSRRMRSQLATLLADVDDLEPMRLGQLIEDDELLSRRLQDFLAQHRIPYAGPVIDRQGRYLWEDQEKISQLARYLTKAVAKGRDNELFVIMAGLLDLEFQLGPFIQAIKVATARHHRVMVICAWPPGMEPPHIHRRTVLDRMPMLAPEEMAAAVSRQQLVTAFQRLRSELGRCHVPVIAAAESLATRLVLAHVELIRSGRSVA